MLVAHLLNCVALIEFILQPTDIIAFKLNNQTVTHRVVSVNKDEETFITKGDANKERDAVPVSFINYVGRDVFSIPYLGRVVSFFKSIIGIVVLVSFILLSMLLVVFEKDNDKDNAYEK